MRARQLQLRLHAHLRQKISRAGFEIAGFVARQLQLRIARLDFVCIEDFMPDTELGGERYGVAEKIALRMHVAVATGARQNQSTALIQ